MGSNGKDRTIALHATSVPTTKLDNYFCTNLREDGWRGSKNHNITNSPYLIRLHYVLLMYSNVLNFSLHFVLLMHMKNISICCLFSGQLMSETYEKNITCEISKVMKTQKVETWNDSRNV